MIVDLLKDKKIVSLAINLPGPLAVARLRQMGAEIVKVEPPGGDPLAEMCPEWYDELVEGQKIVRLNLKDPWEKAELEDLLHESNVLVTSMRPAALERLGFGWKQLHRFYPRLSLVSIIGFPSPQENLAGHDLTYQAAANLLSPPEMPRTLLADLAAAERVYSAALALLLAKEKNFPASCEQVSIMEAVEDFAAPLRYNLTDKDCLLGGKSPNYGLYQTAQDGWIALAALEERFKERLEYELNLKKISRKELEEIFLTRTALEWKTWAIKSDVPLEIVETGGVVSKAHQTEKTYKGADKFMKRIFKYISLPLILFVLAATFICAQTAQQNEYEQKAKKLATAIQYGAVEPRNYYNAACFFALAGKTDEAFRYLEQAIKRGYANVEHIKQDSDLTSLHGDARWQKMIAQAEAKQKEQESLFWNKKEFWNNPALKTPYQENIGENEKIAGLSKFWSEIKYNFANFDLVPDINWDALYFEYIPKVRATKSTLEYYRVLQELCARLRDGHTNVYMPEAMLKETAARPLIRTGLIEDKILIVGVFGDELKRNGIEAGQEIVEIDGIPVKQYADQSVKPYQSASTLQDINARVFDYALINGSVNKPIELTLRDAKGNGFKKTLSRVSREERRAKLPRTPFEYKLFTGNVAYVALNAFDDMKAAEMFEARYDEIARADAIIFDLRDNGGGNSGVGYRILAHLTDKPFKGSSWYTRQYRPTFRAWERAQEVYGREAGEIAPNGKHLYTKPVTVLTSPRTYSAAEDFAVAFINMKRGTIIGEATGGSTGQPMFFDLPGGGSARVCTKRDRFPDGSDFVGKGVQPDKIVVPKVSDFRAGRDTVLKAALSEVNKSSKNKGLSN